MGLLLLGVLLWAAEVYANSGYLTELLYRADTANLAERREWQTLLHYRATTDGKSMVSDADDPRFFLASNGKTDPDAELVATLRAFFSTKLVGADPQLAQCAFIGRYRWLKSELDFDERHLPSQSCKKFQQWFHNINVETVTLVFASAYLNNPASLFGHTLLRLDQHGQTKQTRLLSYAINYAADDTNSHGVMYAVDGIAGGFKGSFDIQRYYKLVRTYSDLESRDIWEYQLKLSQSQLQRLLEHAWELRHIEFDYYFLRENCAWQLLTLLEVADPSLRLSDEFTLWTLPADTIRHLSQRGLIGEVTARPARGARIRRRYATLTTDERRLVYRLRNDPAVVERSEFVRLQPERKALLLELSLDERQYRWVGEYEDDIELPPDAVAHQLSVARHRLPGAATPVTIAPYATRPETGHASRRFGMSFGQRDGIAFTELNARASYHDLLEPDAGYTPDAQIELMSIAVRRYENSNKLALNRLTLLDITSLAPFDALRPRPAWRVHTGWEPYPKTDCLDCGALNFSGGLGLTVESRQPWRIVWFGLPTLELDYSNSFIENYRAGVGMTIGALLQPTMNWKVMAQASWLSYRFGETGIATRAALRQHLALGQDFALRLDWRYLEGWREWSLGLLVYF